MATRTLPLTGALLAELSLHGNGKDCLFSFVTESPRRRVRIEMRDPRLAIEVDGRVLIESFSHGDRDLGVRYRPLEELRIATFELNLCNSDDQWDAALARFESGQAEFLDEMVSTARIVLVGRQGRVE